MADDIITSVAVEGGAEAEKVFDNIANAGVAAFNKLKSSAQEASRSLSQVGDNIQSAFTPGTEQFKRTTKAAEELRNSFIDFGRSAKVTTQVVGSVIVGAATLAAGFAAVVRSLTAAARGTKDYSEAQRKLQAEQQLTNRLTQIGIQSEEKIADIRRKSAQSSVDATQEYSSAVGDLQSQLESGAISQQEFDQRKAKLSKENTDQVLKGLMDEQKAIDEAIKARDRQIATEIKMAIAREEEAKATAKAKKALEEKVAFDKLSDQFGGSLASALVKLGTVAENLRKRFVEAFGPAAAGLVSGLADLISQNSDRILELARNIGSAISSALGPDTLSGGQKAFDLLLGTMKALGEALTSIIIPAFQGLIKALDGVASVINSVFGTEFNGKQIAAAAAVLKLAGAFSAVGAAIRVIIAIVSALVAVFGGVPVAIAAIVAALAIFIFNAVGGIEGIKKIWTETWTAISDFFVQFINAVVQIWNDSWTAIGNFFTTIIDGIKSGWQSLSDGVSAVVEAIIGFFASLPEKIGGYFDEIGNFVSRVWDGIVEISGNVRDAIIDAFKAAIETVTGFFDNLWTKVKEIFQKISDMAKAIFGDLGTDVAVASSSDSVGFARGGPVRGPGTSTSDSIPAWLSRDEFVMRAKARRKYGLAFMNAINNLRFDPRKFQHFASGGLVMPSPALAMASGDRTPSTRRSFDLVIEGQRFPGLTAPEDTIDNLERYAVSRRISSAGKRPAWKGQR